MHIVVPIMISYLLGSITFSFIVGKLWKGIDVRKHGSGNAGATNTLRVLGKGPAIIVLLLDVCKGVLAVWVGRWIGGEEWIAALCGLAVIIGHNWPVFFGFKGGKGIASAIGVFIALSFLSVLSAGIIALLVIAWSRYVSLGSLILATFMPIFVLVYERPAAIFWMSIAILILAIYRHRVNIVKLVKGDENKLSFRK